MLKSLIGFRFIQSVYFRILYHKIRLRFAMHELSIANTIFDIVLKEKTSKNLPEIKAIGLNIGLLSGILPDALEFSFDAIKIETALANTILEITEVPITGTCNNCQHSFSVTDYIFCCPHCSSSSIKMEQGQELDIAYIEIEDEAEVTHEQ